VLRNIGGQDGLLAHGAVRAGDVLLDLKLAYVVLVSWWPSDVAIPMLTFKKMQGMQSL